MSTNAYIPQLSVSRTKLIVFSVVCNVRTVRPKMFPAGISNCTNLLRPELNQTRHRIFAFIRLPFGNLDGFSRRRLAFIQSLMSAMHTEKQANHGGSVAGRHTNVYYLTVSDVHVQVELMVVMSWNSSAMHKEANSAFHPSGVGKWVPATAGKAKAGMVHSVAADVDGRHSIARITPSCRCCLPRLHCGWGPPTKLCGAGPALIVQPAAVALSAARQFRWWSLVLTGLSRLLISIILNCRLLHIPLLIGQSAWAQL